MEIGNLYGEDCDVIANNIRWYFVTVVAVTARTCPTASCLSKGNIASDQNVISIPFAL